MESSRIFPQKLISAELGLREIRDTFLNFASQRHSVMATGGVINHLDIVLFDRLSRLGRQLEAVILLSKSGFTLEAFALLRRFFEWAILDVYQLMPGETEFYQLVNADAVNQEIEIKKHCKNAPYGTVCVSTTFDISLAEDDIKMRLLRNPIDHKRSTLIHKTPPKVRQSAFAFKGDEFYLAIEKWEIKHNLDFSSVVAKMHKITNLPKLEIKKIQSHFNFLSSFVHAKETLESVMETGIRRQSEFDWSISRTIDLYVISIIWLELRSIEPLLAIRKLLDESKSKTLSDLVVLGSLAASELAFPFAPKHKFDIVRSKQEREVKGVFGQKLFSNRGEYLDYDYINRVVNLNFPDTVIGSKVQWVPESRLGF